MTARVIYDAELVEDAPRSTGWTSPDWLTPGVYRFLRLLGRITMIVVAFIVIGLATDEAPDYTTEPARIDLPTCVYGCAKLREEIRRETIDQPTDLPTDGLVEVGDTDVTARCWLDLIDAGWTGRNDSGEHTIYADPDAVASWCTHTKRDSRFADRFQADRDGVGVHADDVTDVTPG